MRLSAFLMLLNCLVWQGFAGSLGAIPDPSVEAEHSFWHANVDIHHHHEDGSAHFDDSDESVAHSHIDYGTGSALVAVASDGGLPPLQLPKPLVVADARAAHWSSDTPLRPPRPLN